jgi:hypothetical protein
MTKKLEGKVAVITGATSGMALATAKLFVEEGAYVFITGRRQEQLDAAVKEIGKNVTGVQGDAGNLADLDRLYNAVKAKKGHIDILYASAGLGEFNIPLGAITEANFEDLLRLRTAWEECQASRKRDAIYVYLTAVFDLVAWWATANRALDLAHKALRLQSICPFAGEKPFAAIIRCTADPAKVDKRTRSKWSRALRYALEYKPPSEPLDQFIKRKGGINECASRCTRRLGRSRAFQHKAS